MHTNSFSLWRNFALPCRACWDLSLVRLWSRSREWSWRVVLRRISAFLQDHCLRGGHCKSSESEGDHLFWGGGRADAIIMLGPPRPTPVQLTGWGISVVLMTHYYLKGIWIKLTKEKSMREQNSEGNQAQASEILQSNEVTQGSI